MSLHHTISDLNRKPLILDSEGDVKEKHIRVLLVDDDAEFLKCAKELLGMQGDFEVTVALWS